MYTLYEYTITMGGKSQNLQTQYWWAFQDFFELNFTPATANFLRQLRLINFGSFVSIYLRLNVFLFFSISLSLWIIKNIFL